MWWIAKKVGMKVVTVGLVTLAGFATRRILEKGAPHFHASNGFPGGRDGGDEATCQAAEVPLEKYQYPGL